MSLVTCEDCNAQISDKALACPNCGRPNGGQYLEPVPEQKKVSFLLGIGIFLLPIIFAWFTLKKGYSRPAKIISFAWLGFFLLMSLIEQTQDTRQLRTQPLESNQKPEAVVQASQNKNTVASRASNTSKQVIQNGKTTSRINIESVIKSLKTYHGIKASNSGYEEGLDMTKLCWNENACEVYAKTVQIHSVHNSVKVFTSIKETPQYFQKVCSAVMIALTGANKELVEQSITSFFNHASQNGRTEWKVLGIEITVAPDSEGLLGCEFYKQR